MKLFDGQEFIRLYSLLEKATAVINRGNADQLLSKRYFPAVSNRMNEVKALCDALGLSTAAMKATAVIGEIKPELKRSDFGDACEALAEIIRLEISSHLFMYVEPTKAQYFLGIDLFGHQVSEAFPLAKDDIEEAGKCLALNRGTACIFHLMRVLEAGLYAIADALEVEEIEPNWHNAIEQTEKKIRALPSNTPQAKIALAFYSDAAAYLFAVKEPWRNRSAHTGQIYTEEKAQQIFDSVRGFMQVLSTKLTEKPL